MPCPAAEDLDWAIGPSLLDSLKQLGVPDPMRAQELYRERYGLKGWRENRVYDGIPEALDDLNAGGFRLHLATAKTRKFALRITDHFGLDTKLDQQFGPTPDGTMSDKADLLAYALQKTGARPECSVMVGDRIHDIRAARAVGMPCIAVTWGYGARDEAGQADAVCDHPVDLPRVVRQVLDGA